MIKFDNWRIFVAMNTSRRLRIGANLFSSFVLAAALSWLLPGCGNPGFTISSLQPIVNFNLPSDRSFQVDMDSVIIDGIQAPTVRQCPDGKFTFSFSLDNPEGKTLYYKVFYQNESYRFPELVDGQYDSLCEENFYGTWGETDLGFLEVPGNATSVTSGFRILGNPRNEHRFFGIPMVDYQVNEEDVRKEIASIRNSPEWLEGVRKKAEGRKVPLDRQLELDALFSLSYQRDIGETNHRWKRNPRMGRYSMLLVVCTKEDLDKMPFAIKDITLKQDGHYMDPYYYFLHGDGSKLKHTRVLLDTNAIVLKSKIDLTKGIFIDKAEQQNYQEFSAFNNDCNSSDNLFRSAQIQQFFHAENRDYLLNTIPLIKDVASDEYTRDDYTKALTSFKPEQMIKDFIRSTECPCKTVSFNKEKKSIQIFNPKSTDLAHARKENVGIKTRVGYTYGKFTAKIKFPSQINSSNVFNGVTNAFWMLFQDKQAWNFRRPAKSGYSEKGYFSPQAPRSPATYYSEIDFELVKTSRHWPKEVYQDGKGPVENAQLSDEVIVTATNWDLTNSDPVRYAKGFCPIDYQGRHFLPFRWETYYQALTIRTPEKNTALYAPDYYYYQIEWRPTEIIWRIGPSKDQLHIIGYMNDSITSIPNNQMIMVVTQEYHLTDWWPPMPFKQEFIPFLSKDLKGEIYDFEIE